jgi:hypothetical protein
MESYPCQLFLRGWGGGRGKLSNVRVGEALTKDKKSTAYFFEALPAFEAIAEDMMLS